MSSESLLSEHEADEPSVGLLRSEMEARNEHQKIKIYKTFYALTTSVGIGILVIILFWILYFREGFAWQSTPHLEFNWHPFLMVLSMVFMYSQSILIYRTGRTVVKTKLKIIHASIHGAAFIFSVIGLKAVFDSHNLAHPPIANLYTLHSWMGLITVIIFAAQFLSGFITFLFPGLSKTYRKALMPVHVAFGTAGFVLALASALIGLTEKTLWSIKDGYADLPGEAVVLNIIGLCIVFYGALVLYLVHEASYKRVALPEDEIALQQTD